MIFGVYLLCGIVGGLLSGLLGIGGGLVLVPAFLALFEQQGLDMPVAPVAVGTAFMVTACTTFAAARAHYRYGSIRWDRWRATVPASAVGVLIGTFIVRGVAPAYWGIAFGCLLCFSAFQMLRPPPVSGITVPGALKDVFFGFLIGVIGGLFGIGGGILWVPFFRWQGMSLLVSIGTSVACMFPIAVLGALSSALLGDIYWPAFCLAALGSIIAAPVGVWLARRYTKTFVRYAFVVALLSDGVYQIIRGILS